MNNTKTIFKSLLIMIVAISLFTVSCSKDEGGTKNPTNPNPTIKTISATDITTILKALKLEDKSYGGTTVVDLSNINPERGSATIGNANKSYSKVSTALKNVFTTASFNNEKIALTKDPTIADTKPSTTTAPLSVELTFKANGGYEFDTTITKGDAYTYSDTDKTATLTLKISPEGGSWED